LSLSDREKQVLEQLERDLYATDAKFANRIASPKSLKALVGGAALSLVGISIIVFAVIVQVFWFGLLGFATLLAGLVVASSNWMSQSDSEQASKKSPKTQRTNYFQERWDKRQGQ
jgi:hypothetical protein